MLIPPQLNMPMPTSIPIAISPITTAILTSAIINLYMFNFSLA